MPSSPPLAELSLAQARRVTLRSQGLDRRRPERDAGAVTMRQFQQVVDRLQLLQIDSVNVLARAHLMPTWSRIGAYDVALLDRASGRGPRRLVESWAHEASFVPPSVYRLLGWRRRRYLDYAWGSVAEVPLRYAPVVEEVRAILADSGPRTAREVHAIVGAEHPHTRDEWGWNWTVAKRALEFLFFTGEITSARRNSAFERCYDLTERVLPADVLALPEPSDADARRALLEIGARVHGVGTLRCFADYFRLKGPDLEGALAELVEEGAVTPVHVRGWDRPTYLHRDARLPRSVSGRALLSPFDPLVFERRRLSELFDMHYRIEIYTPEPKRVYGYYVLPFLLGDSIAARVDLKADRKIGELRVPGAFLEAAAPPATAGELAEELRQMAAWLGLDSVVVPDDARGDLAGALRALV